MADPFMNIPGYDDFSSLFDASPEAQVERDKKRLSILESEYKAGGESDKSLAGDIEKLKMTGGGYGSFPKYTGLSIDEVVDHNNTATNVTGPIKIDQIKTESNMNLSDDFKALVGIDTSVNKEAKLSSEMEHKPFDPIESYRGLDPMTDLALAIKDRITNPMKGFEEFATKLKENPTEIFVDSFGGGGIIKGVYKNIFTQKALDTALDLVKKNPDTHTFVNISPRMFLDMAYPIRKTSEEVNKALIKPLSEMDIANRYLIKKENVDKYISQGGVNEVLYLKMKGGQIDWHEGRTRALAALARGVDKVPVVIIDEAGNFAKNSPYYKNIISEYGDKMTPSKELSKDIIKE